jgi:glycogen phosphorylase
MVKPVATVNVIPKLPKQLARLTELAYNLRFAWDHETVMLFRRLDPELWEATNHNPVLLLGRVSQERLEQAKNDPAFMAHLEQVFEDFDVYMKAQHTWYREHYGKLPKQPTIAYFSMEFGLTECLQNYSGGLGVLSGDHLKSASDLGLPLVGVGIIYQEGYFQQYLNADGWQQERYPINDFPNLPIILERNKEGQPIKISVDLPGRKLYAQIWRVQIGRIPLYLLDSNIPDNRDEDRNLTDRLYGGDKRTRIRQEILLGIGGIRALEALGHRPDVCHMNEGHSAFMALERIRNMMREKGLSFYQAKDIVAANTVFTVHTNVPAGLERFGFDLIDEHFTDYMRELGLSRDEFINLGRENMGTYELFSMSLMALDMSYGTNGVAKLHGDVCRSMWNWVYPRLPKDEVPITHVTNGIHVQTWVSREMGTLFDRYLDPQWRTADWNPEVWAAVEHVPDSELWRTHSRRRERLVAFCRERLKQQLTARGASQSEIDSADEILNPDTLTIGFARRFATYKRATMIFRDLNRLRKIVNNADCPIQFIFAGKAHPHDNEGKAYIKEIVRIANMEEFRHNIVFIENYDMNVARYLVQGSDVWLNNPRRPKEASGTSGMKGVYNGCLNFSILDGWWDEAYNSEVGWAIGNGEEYPDAQAAEQDRIESEAFYNILEKDLIPKFYNRGRDTLPREWIGMMKNGVKQLGAFFSTHRMVQQYTEMFYIPNFERGQKMTQPTLDPALAYTNWRNHVRGNWNKIRVVSVNVEQHEITVGSKADVTAVIDLGGVTPSDVRVQLYLGMLNSRGEITDGEAITMELANQNGGSQYTFKATYKYNATGELGVSVRVLPYHEFMHTLYQPGMITWA